MLALLLAGMKQFKQLFGTARIPQVRVNQTMMAISRRYGWVLTLHRRSLGRPGQTQSDSEQSPHHRALSVGNMALESSCTSDSTRSHAQCLPSPSGVCPSLGPSAAINGSQQYPHDSRNQFYTFQCLDDQGNISLTELVRQIFELVSDDTNA